MRTRPAHFPGTVVQRTVRTLLFVCFHQPDYQSMSKPDLHTCTETSYLTHGPSFLTRYSYPVRLEQKKAWLFSEYCRNSCVWTLKSQSRATCKVAGIKITLQSQLYAPPRTSLSSYCTGAMYLGPSASEEKSGSRDPKIANQDSRTTTQIEDPLKTICFTIQPAPFQTKSFEF